MLWPITPPPATRTPPQASVGRDDYLSSTLAAIRWTSSAVNTGIEQAPLAQAKAAASGRSGDSTSAAGGGASPRARHSGGEGRGGDWGAGGGGGPSRGSSHSRRK